MHEIRIGGQEHEYLLIQVLDRDCSENKYEYFEANWLAVQIEARAGCFRGSVSGYFQAEDFVRLRQQLDDLLQWKEDSAEFSTLEGWLSMRFTMDERGRITVLGDLVDRPMDGNRLRFELAIDQSYLSSVISDLDRAISAFPVIGTPPVPQ